MDERVEPLPSLYLETSIVSYWLPIICTPEEMVQTGEEV